MINLTIKEILEGKKVLFFGYARTALEFGYKYLGIHKGDEILYPDYICDTTSVPANNLGVSIKYYRTNDQLEPDFEDAAKLVTKKSKAFLAVNYFGFPQPFTKIRQFCQQNNLYFIEDNAHSFLSQTQGKYLGSFGDISVLSFRKIVPLVNGAALLVNTVKSNNFHLIENGLDSLIEEKSLFKNLKCLAQRFCRIVNFDLSKFKKALKKSPEPGNTENEQMPYKIHKLTLSILSRYDLTSEGQQRKNNYQKILSSVNDNFKPIFSYLPEGVVPLGCPFYTNERDYWFKYFRDKRIRAYVWPTLPKWVAQNSENAIKKWQKILVFRV